MTSESLPHWDLSNVYPGLESEEFGQATGLIAAQIEDLDRYLAAKEITRGGTVPQDPEALAETIGGYLDKMNAILSCDSLTLQILR